MTGSNDNSNSASTIVFLEPGNPHDFTEAELADLVACVREADPAHDVQLHVRDEIGYGVSYHEVLHIWAVYKEISGDIADTAGMILPFAAAVKWMQARWKSDRESDASDTPRPRSVSLVDERGNIIESVEINLPTGDAVDTTGKPRPHGDRSRLRPPTADE